MSEEKEPKGRGCLRGCGVVAMLLCLPVGVFLYVLHTVNPRPLFYVDRLEIVPLINAWGPSRGDIRDSYGNYAIADTLSNIVVLIETLPSESQAALTDRATAPYVVGPGTPDGTWLSHDDGIRKNVLIPKTTDRFIHIDLTTRTRSEFTIQPGQAEAWRANVTHHCYGYYGEYTERSPSRNKLPNLATDTLKFFKASPRGQSE